MKVRSNIHYVYLFFGGFGPMYFPIPRELFRQRLSTLINRGI